MSLKAIAKQLGISVTTVSRALNGYDDVSQEILMQSIWQTITAPPVTIPFSLMWLCVFALELIMHVLAPRLEYNRRLAQR